MTWSTRSVEALAARRTRKLKQSRIIDLFAATRHRRPPLKSKAKPSTKALPKNGTGKVITKVSEIKIVLRGLDVDLLANESPPPLTPVEKPLALKAMPEPYPLACTESICTCWDDLTISVGNVCTLCSTTKYSGFQKLDMYGVYDVPISKVPVQQQPVAQAQTLQVAKAPKSQHTKPPPASKAYKTPKAPSKPKLVKVATTKVIKKPKMRKVSSMPTTPTMLVEQPLSLPVDPEPIALNWNFISVFEELVNPDLFTPDEIDNLFNDF